MKFSATRNRVPARAAVSPIALASETRDGDEFLAEDVFSCGNSRKGLLMAEMSRGKQFDRVDVWVFQTISRPEYRTVRFWA